MVTVEDRPTGPVPVRLRGNRDHPFTAGGLCKKVNPWLRHAADPSRLLTPQKRVGAKGEGRFAPIGWDDAIGLLAERIDEAIDRHGPEAVWPFVGTGNVGWIQGAAGGERLWNALGVSQHQVSICSVSGWVGLGYTIGTGATVDPEETDQAGVIVIWGSNTLVTDQHWWPFVERARASGVPVVVIDPLRTRTAERADLHIAPRPGTDGALALGMARQLRDRGAADRQWLGDNSVGWDEFSASLDQWTLERTAETCGLEPAEIQRLVDVIDSGLDTGPLLIKLGQGMQRHAGGGQAARVVSCLPAFTGSYGRPGGGLAYSTGNAYGLDRVALNRPDLRSAPARSLAMTNLGRNLLELDDPPVTVLMVIAANPMVSNPQTDLVRAGLARDDLFTTVIDCYPTDTVAWADLVLPSTLQHEHVEMNDSFAHLYLNWNEPAVPPAGECLPHTEILRRLARALGRTEPELFATDHELAAAALSGPVWRDAGIGLDDLRAVGFARIPGTEPFRPLAGADADEPGQLRFETASGRFEFASDRAERDGHGRLPHYVAPIEAATSSSRTVGVYDLVANGSDLHINSVFAGTDVTAKARADLGWGDAVVLTIHPDDAARDGLSGGDAVRVENERGAFDAVVTVGPGTRPGVAAAPKGAWGRGINTTVVERDSDMGRGAVYHDNTVTIT
ncbi:MAG: molybdopterin-containing oxidoreductase family protein, partial [Acidimicrobiales bacterium]